MENSGLFDLMGGALTCTSNPKIVAHDLSALHSWYIV